MVAINIIGDPADFSDENNIVSLGSFIPEEENLFLMGGAFIFVTKKSIILKIVKLTFFYW